MSRQFHEDQCDLIDTRAENDELIAVIKLMLTSPGNITGRAIAEHLISEIEGES